MTDSLWKRIKDRQAQLEDIRRPFESVYSLVIDYMRPELSGWSSDTMESKGGKRGLKVYSGHPEEALGNWSDGMQGHLVSSAILWFNYMMGNREINGLPDVRKFMQDSEEMSYSILGDSNFYPALGPVFRDGGSLGDTVLFMDQDDDGMDFKSFHPREVYHSKGILHRKFWMAAKDAEIEFGLENLSDGLGRQLDKNSFERYEFIFICYKKDDRIFKGIENVPDRKYVTAYIQTETDLTKQEPLRMLGYNSKPYAHWAYALSPDSDYGTGIGYHALVDVGMLNEVAKSNMKAQQQAVDPAVMADKALRGRLNMNPHGVTWTTGNQRVEPILNNLNVPLGLEREDRLMQMIDRRFNVDFFLMLARAEKAMTATEIFEKVGEKSILLSPKIGRLERYLLNQVHERIFEVAMENNWLPKIPDILYAAGGQIDIDYIGPLAQAQKRLLDMRRYERTIATIGPVLQASPQSMDYWDADKTVVRVMRSDNWPEDEIRTEEEVQELRRQRAEQEKAMREAEMAAGAADVVPKLSGKVEEGSVLEQLTGGG